MTDKRDDSVKHKDHDKEPAPGEVTPNALPDDESGGGGTKNPPPPSTGG